MNAERREVPVYKAVLSANDRLAKENERLFARHGVVVFNLIGSPGSGKTSLLEQTAQQLGAPMGVVEGDIATSRDAARLDALGVPAVQINTRGGCHLDAAMVHEAVAGLRLAELDFVFIENVGNLVCPVEFELGERAKVVVYSVPEGGDKPQKYPLAFRKAGAIVINKIDMASQAGFDFDQVIADIRRINGEAPIFKVSCRTGEGVAEWVEWLRRSRS